MSGNIASRYIGGVPYGPGRSVGRYPNAASVGAMPGVVNAPTVQVRPVDTSGVVTPVSSGVAAAGGGGGGGSGGGDNLLLAAALGLLPYLPDAYSAIDGLLNPAETQAQAPPGIGEPLAAGQIPAGTAISPGQALILRNGQTFQAPAGATMDIDGIVNLPGGGFEELSPWEAGPSGFSDLPAAPLDEGVGAIGGGGMDFGTLSAADDPFYGSLGENPLFGGDLATGLAGAGGAALGGLISAQAPWTRQGYGAIGQQAGSAIGGIGAGALIGSALGPIGTAFGALAGSLIGGFGGGAAGSQIGPAPTVGRNFSSIGTFGGDGGLSWGNSGGDNGASAADADPFANWFAQNLQQQAAAQGLAFNPNMAGAQVRVGGYDNFNRRGRSPAGGYFYDITNQGGTFGGSPEQYALRPSDDFASDPFSARQADAFTTNVLADLAARNVFTPGGAAIGGQGDLMGTLGTGYGWYGGLGSDYSQIEYGGSGGFNDILGGRQNAITGYVNQQQAQSAANAAAQQVLGGAYNPFNSYDPNFGWQAMAANMPAGGAPAGPPDIYQAMASGMQGVQMGENGPIFASVGGAGGTQVPAGWNMDGGA